MKNWCDVTAIPVSIVSLRICFWKPLVTGDSAENRVEIVKVVASPRFFAIFFFAPRVRYTIRWNARPWQRSSVDYAVVTICADDKRLQNEKKKIRKISETKRKTTGSIKYSCTIRCRRHVPRRDLRRTRDVLNPSSCAPGRKQFIKRDFKLMYVREKKREIVTKRHEPTVRHVRKVVWRHRPFGWVYDSKREKNLS